MTDLSSYEKHLEKAKAKMAGGFTSKAAQKDCTGYLSAAFNSARMQLQKSMTSKYQPDENGCMADTAENRAIQDQYYAVASELHHYRPKHTAILLAIDPELKSLADIFESLVALRKEALAMEITKPKTKDELELEGIKAARKGVIGKAVDPMRTSAIERAQEWAEGVINRVMTALEKCKFHSLHLEDRWEHACSILTLPTPKAELPEGQEYLGAFLRKRSSELEAKFIKQAVENAALEFDRYVYKLSIKTGAVKTATLKSQNIWENSLLTVELKDGEVQHWSTKMIVNFSKHGKAFNQFPTRQVKTIDS